MWWVVWFKGGDTERSHRETMGVQANNADDARKEAMRKMINEFGIRYPEIYSIELMPGGNEKETNAEIENRVMWDQAQEQEREMVVVTREMASDAGCPEMEGAYIRW